MSKSTNRKTKSLPVLKTPTSGGRHILAIYRLPGLDIYKKSCLVYLCGRMDFRNLDNLGHFSPETYVKISINDLADELSISERKMHLIIKELVEEGYINKENNANNIGRSWSNNYFITNKIFTDYLDTLDVVDKKSLVSSDRLENIAAETNLSEVGQKITAQCSGYAYQEDKNGAWGAPFSEPSQQKGACGAPYPACGAPFTVERVHHMQTIYSSSIPLHNSFFSAASESAAADTALNGGGSAPTAPQKVSDTKLTRAQEKRITEIATMLWLTNDKHHNPKLFKIPFSTKITLLTTMAKEFGIEKIEIFYTHIKSIGKLGEVTYDAKELFYIFSNFEEWLTYIRQQNGSNNETTINEINLS